MIPRHLAFPLHVGATRRLADAELPTYVRGLIESILFTDPGERVNRPQFGCGLSSVVFEAATPEVLAATQHLVERNLTTELMGFVDDVSAQVSLIDSELHVVVRYTLSGDEQQREVRFVR